MPKIIFVGGKELKVSNADASAIYKIMQLRGPELKFIRLSGSNNTLINIDNVLYIEGGVYDD